MNDSRMNDLPKNIIDADIINNAKAWPCQEAVRIQKHISKDKGTKDNPVIFETGYGPSGLPHIGTFGEVLRTTMVRKAFEQLTGLHTKLIAFSDDMDGLRKVPDNIPNAEMVAKHLNYPLSQIPDPFGEYESYAAHNNARLRAFLDQFGFEYEFASASQYYHSCKFDDALLRMLTCYDAILKTMLPTLGTERQKTYSPFLPICPETNHVLQVPIIAVDDKAGTILYQRDDGKEIETKVTAGHCKMQWKPDWAMRWYALGVDYEMFGKDLIDSASLATKICQILAKDTKQNPPVQYFYELFLDEEGKKISKSKGNGLSLEEWLHYAPQESLAYYMYQKPKTAKRLYFDIIPKAVDEYTRQIITLQQQEPEKKIENPTFHLYQKEYDIFFPISFSLLLTLTTVCNSNDISVLWGFVIRYCPNINKTPNEKQKKILQYAINYYEDFIKPHKKVILAEGKNKEAIIALYHRFKNTDLRHNYDGEAWQKIVYDVGMEFQYDPLRDWFKILYQSLLGQNEGPRIGSLFALYGYEETLTLIESSINK